MSNIWIPLGFFSRPFQLEAYGIFGRRFIFFLFWLGFTGLWLLHRAIGSQASCSFMCYYLYQDSQIVRGKWRERRKVNTAQSEEGEYLSPHSFRFHGLKNKQANICVNIWSYGSESTELYIVVEDKHTFSYFGCLLHEFRSVFWGTRSNPYMLQCTGWSCLWRQKSAFDFW